MRIIKRHWLALLGALSTLPGLFRAAVWLLDWSSRLDFITGKIRTLGWTGAPVALFLNPPPWLPIPTLIIGLLLIWWDLNRNKEASPPKQSVTRSIEADVRRYLSTTSLWDRLVSKLPLSVSLSARQRVAAATSRKEFFENLDKNSGLSDVSKTVAAIAINFEPKAPYESSEIIKGHVLNTVRIGLKANSKTFANCIVYVEKIAPQPALPGGLPIRLSSEAPMLRPDDPETLIDVAAHWDHVTKFRFSSPAPWSADSLNYIDDDPPRTIEIRVKAIDFETTALFRIWTDSAKKLHLARQ